MKTVVFSLFSWVALLAKYVIISSLNLRIRSLKVMLIELENMNIYYKAGPSDSDDINTFSNFPMLLREYISWLHTNRDSLLGTDSRFPKICTAGLVELAEHTTWYCFGLKSRIFRQKRQALLLRKRRLNSHSLQHGELLRINGWWHEMNQIGDVYCSVCWKPVPTTMGNTTD